MNRRQFLAAAAASAAAPLIASAQEQRKPGLRQRLRLSLAAYSFRDFLTGKKPPEMNLEQFVDRCAEMDLDAVELTSYYFPPDVTPQYIAGLKRRCFLAGLDISGTPVGNEFTHPEGPERDKQIRHVKTWIEHASLLGAPAIRIFAGSVKPGQTKEQARAAAVESIRACLEHAAARGVVLALENHGGIVAEADDLLEIVRTVNSDWCGINLDTGNFRTDDPYADIEKCAPLAVTVQVKTEVTPRGGQKQDADLKRVVEILKKAGYRGYVTLEYEAAEDPLAAVPRHLAELRALLQP